MILLAVHLYYEYSALAEIYYMQISQKKQRANLDACFDTSSCGEPEVKGNFLVVNREMKHLKKEAALFAHEQHIKNNEEDLYDDQVEFAAKHEAYFASTHGSQRVPKRAHVVPKSFCWPVERSSFWLSSLFGPRKKENGRAGFHFGIDMAARRGTPVKAVALGSVIEAQANNGYGNTVLIKHADDIYQTRYAHLDKIFVRKGQRVVKGQKIGSVGNTGFVRGRQGEENAHHLHFEVKRYGKNIDPLKMLPT
ncbi:MAG: M23 family metallopeptidase [Candidatus Babeliales bacterium]